MRKLTADLYGAQLGRSVQVEPTRCFAGACVVTVTYFTREVVQEADKISDKLADWPGGKIVTPLLDEPTGTIRASLILLRPADKKAEQKP